MVAHNSDMVAPAELTSYWDLLSEKWRAKIVVMDPRYGGYGRSGARAIFYHPQLGAEYLAPAVDRTSGHGIARLHASDQLAGAKTLCAFAVRQRRRRSASQGSRFTGQRFRHRRLERRRQFGTGRLPCVVGTLAPSQRGKSFINWLLSRDGQIAVQKDGGVNDSLRIDIPKNDLRPWRGANRHKLYGNLEAEWMDFRADAKGRQSGVG
jgi:hypothetical protein